VTIKDPKTSIESGGTTLDYDSAALLKRLTGGQASKGLRLNDGLENDLVEDLKRPSSKLNSQQTATD
jgi:hypothetical protein